MIEIAGLNPGLVFIGRHDREIVGYVTFHRPDPFTRWLGHTHILELGAIEVSPGWRRLNIGSALLTHAFFFPFLEKYIVVTTEYCWHWDLTGTNLDVWAYRDMLTALFKKVGLIVRPTDDADIAEHPANVLMARIGALVSLADEVAFDAMLFDNKPSGASCR